MSIAMLCLGRQTQKGKFCVRTKKGLDCGEFILNNKIWKKYSLQQCLYGHNLPLFLKGVTLSEVIFVNDFGFHIFSSVYVSQSHSKYFQVGIKIGWRIWSFTTLGILSILSYRQVGTRGDTVKLENKNVKQLEYTAQHTFRYKGILYGEGCVSIFIFL